MMIGLDILQIKLLLFHADARTDQYSHEIIQLPIFLGLASFRRSSRSDA